MPARSTYRDREKRLLLTRKEERAADEMIIKLDNILGCKLSFLAWEKAEAPEARDPLDEPGLLSCHLTLMNPIRGVPGAEAPDIDESIGESKVSFPNCSNGKNDDDE